MPCWSLLYPRQLARELMAQGASVKETMECLHKEGIFSCQTVWQFKRHYDQNRSIEPPWRSGQPTKLTVKGVKVISTAMQEDTRTTARKLSVRLQQLHVSHASLETILKGLKVTWLDFLQICLLSTCTCSEQRKAIAFSQKIFTWWFWRCGVHGRNYCSIGDTSLL